MIDRASIMTKAALLRRRLGEDDSSPVDVFALALSMDRLTLVLYPMGNNLSGMCVKGRAGNALVAVNSGMTLGRQRFSLAHELFHLHFDESMTSVCAKNLESGSAVERSADMFASYFLMPETALAETIERLTKRSGHLGLGEVIRVEQYFGVSHQAAIYRLMRARYLSEPEGKELLRRAVRAKAVSMGYGPDLYLPSPQARRHMTYGNYIRQAEQVLRRDLVSLGKYEELLLDAFRADLVYGDEGEEDIVD